MLSRLRDLATMENLQKASRAYRAFSGQQSLGVSRKTRNKKKSAQSAAPSRGAPTRQGYSNQPNRGRNSAQIKTSVAPLQVGAVAGGPIVNFGSASSGNMRGLKMQGSQAWLDVATNATTANLAFCLPGTGAGASNAVQFNPNNVNFTPPPLTTLAANFQRYKLLKLTIRYEPAVPTTDTASFALAWVNDPDMPASLTNTYTAIQGIQNSITFPAYQAWQMDVPIASNQLIWMVDVLTDARFNAPGMLVACCNATGTGVRKGTLYMDYTIDLFDLMAVTGAALTRCQFCKELTPATRIMSLIEPRRETKSSYAHWDEHSRRYRPIGIDHQLEAPQECGEELKATSMRSAKAADEDVELVEVPFVRTSRMISTQDNIPARTPANTPAGGSTRALSLK